MLSILIFTFSKTANGEYKYIKAALSQPFGGTLEITYQAQGTPAKKYYIYNS